MARRLRCVLAATVAALALATPVSAEVPVQSGTGGLGGLLAALSSRLAAVVGLIDASRLGMDPDGAEGSAPADDAAPTPVPDLAEGDGDSRLGMDPDG